VNCLHPHSKKIVNKFTGEVKTITYPCGHCINCLAAFQDSWATRLFATSSAYGSIVFDTLTIRPEAMHYNDIYEDCMAQDYDTLSKISDECWKLLNFYNFKIPYYTKKEVQDWIKRGREQYKRDTGKRLNMKYFIVQELGTKTSRPHFHAIFWGIGYADYMKYFGDVWRKEIGWTKPAYVICNSKSKQDSFKKITQYVSKYVSKGVFECPLVEGGFIEAPFRLISKGIGAELLEKPYLVMFEHPELRSLCKYFKPDDWDEKMESEYGFPIEFDVVEQMREAGDYRSVEVFQNLLNGVLPNGHKLTDEELTRLAVYYDDCGFAHKMPVYYKNKITKSYRYNAYTFAISSLLSASAIVHYNQGLQKTAAGMGILIPDEWLSQDCSLWNLDSRVLFMVVYQYNIAQKNKAYAQAERRKIKLKNTYNRIKTSKDRDALL